LQEPKSLKDEIIRCRIKQWEFDIFAFAKTNIDWRLLTLLTEEAKIYFHTKAWWEALHISHCFNNMTKPTISKQFGGTALFSINKAAHRVDSKGGDNLNLGFWTWRRFRGKNNHTLCLISAYRPNPPSGSPFTLNAQQRQGLNQINDNRCPRAAFVEDLVSLIKTRHIAGDHISLTLDGNTDMNNSDLALELMSNNLREVTLERHGTNGPSTQRRSTSGKPFHRIWASPSINIQRRGYLNFDEVFMNADHR
jgi:hypothetical protein